MKQEDITKITEIIEESQDPFYVFDDDCDGLCSYLLLKRHFKKDGSFMIGKNRPVLGPEYIRKLEEEKPDLLIMLDIPVIWEDAEDNLTTKALWIDHHPIQEVSKIHYFNALNYTKESKSTTWMISQITKQKNWLAALGCIFDFHIPEFIKETQKEYPDLLTKIGHPQEIMYETEFGYLMDILFFNLKGQTKDVKKSVKMLEKIDSPYDILKETTKEGKKLKERAERYLKEYRKLREGATKEITKDKLFAFIYQQNQTSMSNKLAGEMSYKYPEKFIICGREKEDKIIMSLRGPNFEVRDILEQALANVEGRGGGHRYACGAAVKKEDFERFLENIKQQL